MNCDRCGNEVQLFMQGRTLLSPYRIHGILQLCESCGDSANSFVDYWGEKRQEDLEKLKNFLNKGANIKRKYSALINAGYF